ncbi:hypothetical protein QUF31_14225 [Dickeya chrysanthemi]|uniref:hypothetical protein n=1 Tax=Dickeya chrysanthemi TaxID=556 RepID=UPI0025A14114|nr:hypothetical protein [Dickeya chrysanthemi]WJM84304.1 hypothetical protein QUF31_14225 [Dickeya chrysanthemi]
MKPGERPVSSPRVPGRTMTGISLNFCPHFLLSLHAIAGEADIGTCFISTLISRPYLQLV